MDGIMNRHALYRVQQIIDELENEIEFYLGDGVDTSSQPFESARLKLVEAYIEFDRLTIEKEHDEHVEN